MGRDRLRRLLADRDGPEPAVVPLLERHAGRLEGFGEQALATSADAGLRSLRTAQGLYDLDAVPLGRGGRALIDACLALAGACGPPPEPERVAAQPPVASMLDALPKLQATLGERAGVAVTLPTAPALGQAVGQGGSAPDWAERMLQHMVGLLGALEPDLVLVVDSPWPPGSPTEPPDGMTRMANFYGIPLVTVSDAATPGLLVLADEDFGDGRGRSWPAEPVWLVTTRNELAPDLDPAVVRAVLRSARARTPLGGTI